MTWNRLLERYLQHLRNRGRSASTVSDARHWLTLFIDSCGTERPNQVTPAHLVEFHSRMLWSPNSKGHLYAPNSVSHALGVVRACLRWATREGHLLVDPARNLVLPRPVQPLRPQVDTGDVDAMVSSFEDDCYGLRNRAILEVFYQTGVRRSECAALDLVDVDLEGRTLHVHRGKGAKDRRLPVSDDLAAHLMVYLQRARPALEPKPHENALFLSKYGSRLSHARIGQLVRQAANAAGLPAGITPHVLRYAFATHLVQEGADLRHVQEMLGHARVSTTQTYTRLSALEVAKEHRRTHPRARKAPG